MKTIYVFILCMTSFVRTHAIGSYGDTLVVENPHTDGFLVVGVVQNKSVIASFDTRDYLRVSTEYEIFAYIDYVHPAVRALADKVIIQSMFDVDGIVSLPDSVGSITANPWKPWKKAKKILHPRNVVREGANLHFVASRSYEVHEYTDAQIVSFILSVAFAWYFFGSWLISDLAIDEAFWWTLVVSPVIVGLFESFVVPSFFEHRTLSIVFASLVKTWVFALVLVCFYKLFLFARVLSDKKVSNKKVPN